MERYSEDFNPHRAANTHTFACITEHGVRRVSSEFLGQIQHLGIKTHNDDPVFMPEVQIPSKFVVPPADPLLDKYL